MVQPQPGATRGSNTSQRDDVAAIGRHVATISRSDTSDAGEGREVDDVLAVGEVADGVLGPVVQSDDERVGVLVPK